MPIASCGIALTTIFDKVYSGRDQHQLDRLAAKVSVAGLIAHAELQKFIARKKAIALGLTVLLLAVAVQGVIEFLLARARINLNSFFYTDVSQS
jgi:hypothetical protein